MSFDDAFRRAAIAERERDHLADELAAAEQDQHTLRDELEQLDDAIAATRRSILREQTSPSFRGWVWVAIVLMLCILGMTFAVLSAMPGR
jgi:small-conductance mechanosensitive channel